MLAAAPQAARRSAWRLSKPQRAWSQTMTVVWHLVSKRALPAERKLDGPSFISACSRLADQKTRKCLLTGLGRRPRLNDLTLSPLKASNQPMAAESPYAMHETRSSAFPHVVASGNGFVGETTSFEPGHPATRGSARVLFWGGAQQDSHLCDRPGKAV